MTTEARLFVILVSVFLGVATTKALIIGATVAIFLVSIVTLIKIELWIKQNF